MKKNYPKRLEVKSGMWCRCVVRLVWTQKGQNSALSQIKKGKNRGQVYFSAKI